MSNTTITICFFALIFGFSAVLGYRQGRRLFDNWLQGLKEIFDWVARGYLIHIRLGAYELAAIGMAPGLIDWPDG